MKNLFQNRAVGFWLDLAGTVLTLVGIILYALYAADTGSNNVSGYTLDLWRPWRPVQPGW